MAPPTNLHGILMVGFHFKMWSSISLKPEQRESQGQLFKVIGYTMWAQRTGSPVVEELVCYWINLFLWMFVIYWSLWNMVPRSELRGFFHPDIINFKFSPPLWCPKYILMVCTPRLYKEFHNETFSKLPSGIEESGISHRSSTLPLPAPPVPSLKQKHLGDQTQILQLDSFLSLSSYCIRPLKGCPPRHIPFCSLEQQLTWPQWHKQKGR